MDLNAAMEAYCHSFGNRLQELRKYCANNWIADDPADVAIHIDRLENGIFAVVWERSEKQPLHAQEIEEIARDYLNTYAPEVNESGLRAIMRWIGWMAWHEGCMQG